MQHLAPRTRVALPRRLAAARWLVVVVGVALSIAAALVLQHRLAPKHFEVVEPGVLYRSATLRPDRLRDVVAEYGIRTVVNLRSPEENLEPWYATQRAALDEVGVDMIDLPMQRSTTPEPEIVARWLALLDDAAAQPILVHCQYGVLRTGIMVSVYEIAFRGVSPDGLYERMPQFGHDVSAETRERIQRYLNAFAQGGGMREVAGS